MKVALKKKLVAQQIGHVVIMHLRDGRSMTGILVAVYPDAVALRHAKALVDSGDPLDIAGDVIIPSWSISWLQVDHEETV